MIMHKNSFRVWGWAENGIRTRTASAHSHSQRAMAPQASEVFRRDDLARAQLLCAEVSAALDVLASEVDVREGQVDALNALTESLFLRVAGARDKARHPGCPRTASAHSSAHRPLLRGRGGSRRP